MPGRHRSAVEYGKRIKIYPLSKADNPPPTISVDAAGTLYDATIPYDIRFFESLGRVIQHEPWLLSFIFFLPKRLAEVVAGRGMPSREATRPQPRRLLDLPYRRFGMKCEGFRWERTPPLCRNRLEDMPELAGE